MTKNSNNETMVFGGISWLDVVRFFVAVFILAIVVQFLCWYLPSEWKSLEIWKVFSKNKEVNSEVGFGQLAIFYPLLLGYILIGVFALSVVAMIKRGWKKLRGYDEDGLISGLILGLVSWLIFGVIFGVIFWLVSWLIFGLVSWLIFGLIFGLIDEFKPK